MFADRKKEVSFIKEVLDRSGFQMIPVWGRRRIGKTALLLHSISNEGFYFLATESTMQDNLKRFREELSRYLDDATVLALELDWEKILGYVSKKDLTIILDEFPYLISADSSFPSVLQRIIDVHLKDTGTKLFICGSSARMMESFVLDYKAPLYGRRTGQIKLGPLPFRELRSFLPGYSMEDLVRVFGTCGGVPLYLLQFDSNKKIWKNIEDVFFDPFSLMYEEAKFLIKQEFKNIAMYRSILNELASGRTRMGEIKDSLSLSRSDITPYLHNLMSIGLVEREVPVTEDPARSRSGIYRMSDNYMKFHYAYVYKRMGLLESGGTKEVMEFVKGDLDRFLGETFEKVVMEAFLLWAGSDNMSYDRVGRWWRGEEEIDIVGLSSVRNEGVCIEVKWSAKRREIKDIERLLEKGRSIGWGNKRTNWKHLYASRGGFSRTCVDWMDENGVVHWTLKDLESILWAEGRK